MAPVLLNTVNTIAFRNRGAREIPGPEGRARCRVGPVTTDKDPLLLIRHPGPSTKDPRSRSDVLPLPSGSERSRSSPETQREAGGAAASPAAPHHRALRLTRTALDRMLAAEVIACAAS